MERLLEEDYGEEDFAVTVDSSLLNLEVARHTPRHPIYGVVPLDIDLYPDPMYYDDEDDDQDMYIEDFE